MDADLFRVVESDTNLEVRGAAGLSAVRPVAGEPLHVAATKMRISSRLPEREHNNPAGVGENVDVWI